jgi:amidase
MSGHDPAAARRRGLSVASVLVAALLAVAAPALAEGPVIPQADRLRPLDPTPFTAALAGLTPEREAALLALVSSRDLAGLNAALVAGEVTSEELVLLHLARILRHDDALRAFLDLNPAALDEARAADALFRAGTNLGPLQGIPVALKDNIETAGPMHTTANAAILLDNVAEDDAEIVRRLRAAGAVILGKTSLSEFAGVISVGAPRGGSGAVGGQGMNPHGPFPTLGSSSGSGIAVAAMLAPVAVGTETSGSIIAPATATGVVALKPTKGRVPEDGIIPLFSHNDTAGPMGRSVADVAALFAVLEGGTMPPPRFSITALDGVTVGVLAAGVAADRQNAGVLDRATPALLALGARLRPADLADPTGTVPALMIAVGGGLRFETMAYVTARHPELATLEDLIAWNAADPATRAPFGQDLLQVLAQVSAPLTAADLAEAATALDAAATAALEQAFAATGAEVLVSTSSLHADFYATAGWPAVTVPLGLGLQGQPIGLTLIGREGQDERLLEIAWAVEQATRAIVTPPVALGP